MKLAFAAVAATIALTGCQTANLTPKDRYLNRYAGAQTIAAQCPAVGGYGSVAAMREDAQKNLAQARALGATDEDIKTAQQRVNGNMMGATILVGPMQACSAMINSLAMAGSDPVV